MEIRADLSGQIVHGTVERQCGPQSREHSLAMDLESRPMFWL